MLAGTHGSQVVELHDAIASAASSLTQTIQKWSIAGNCLDVQLLLMKLHAASLMIVRCLLTDKDAETASMLRALHRVVRTCVAQAHAPGIKLLQALWDALRPAFCASGSSIYLNKVIVQTLLSYYSRQCFADGVW